MGWCSSIANGLAEEISDLLDGRSIACAESCTGGQVAVVLATAEGSASWFRGGIVAYQVAVKRTLLGVTAPSVFTEDAAAEMANGAARVFAADIAVSTTGLVGDAPEDGEAPGTVFIGVRVDGRTSTSRHQFAGEPAERAEAAVCTALDSVVRALRQRATAATNGHA